MYVSPWIVELSRNSFTEFIFSRSVKIYPERVTPQKVKQLQTSRCSEGGTKMDENWSKWMKGVKMDLNSYQHIHVSWTNKHKHSLSTEGTKADNFPKSTRWAVREELVQSLLFCLNVALLSSTYLVPIPWAPNSSWRLQWLTGLCIGLVA